MKSILKRFITSMIILSMVFGVTIAHGGRTDSSGGHRDNKNASGLGYYHYHHGMGPHLHPNGVCPYDSPKVTKSTQKSTYKKKTVAKPKIKPEYEKITYKISMNNNLYWIDGVKKNGVPWDSRKQAAMPTLVEIM